MDNLPELPADDYMPLDAAVQLMAQGYDLNAESGYAPFDPYFND